MNIYGFKLISPGLGFRTRSLFWLFSGVLCLFCAANTSAQVTFTDVAETTGLVDMDSAIWGDYNNDGYADMVAGRRLYRNEGNGTFLDVTDAAGIAGTGTSGSIFLDFDNDGNLDLFMPANTAIDHGDLLYRNMGDGTFLDVSQAAGMKLEPRQDGYTNMESVSFDYDNDGLLDIFVSNITTTLPFPNFLYHNEGNGRFRDTATEIGLDLRERSGIVPGDYDNDGDLDFFITVEGDSLYDPSPDNQGIDMLYRNEGDGVFVDVAKQAGVQRHANHFSGMFWDYDNDNDLDLLVIAKQYGEVYGYSILYQNNGDGSFTEVTQQAGIELVDQHPSGIDYGDYDNDGWLDLYFTHWQGLGPKQVYLYHNNADGTFTDMARDVGISIHKSVYSASFVDYDNDGDLDISTMRGLTLYRNDGPTAHWLKLKLVGRESNHDAIGARVRVIAGNLSMMREVMGFCHQWYHPEHLPVHFGLAENRRADAIHVRWPSGITQTFVNIPADQHLTIDEFEGIIVVVRRVLPESGHPAGGTPIQIQGEYFLPNSRVLFNGTEAQDIQVVSSSLITAVTPPGVKGLVDVEVVHPDGKRDILESGFRYTTIQLSKLTPESGPTSGGNTIQMDGFGFHQGASVKIGENLLENIFITPVLISGTLPSGQPGVVDVSIINPDGESVVLKRAFTYVPPPEIRSIRPSSMPLMRSNEIKIRGSGFDHTSIVQIGGIAAQGVDFISANELDVRTPSIFDIGPQEVVVNADGQRAVLPDGVTVLAPPKIKSIEPASGGLDGGTKITIIGEETVEILENSFPSRFVSGMAVLIGDVEAVEVEVLSDHVITAKTPPNTPGIKDITIIDIVDQKDRLESAFTYNDLPHITEVIPDNGKLAGGTEVTIQGSGFLPGAKVSFGKDTQAYKSALSIQVLSSSLITAITPSGQPGLRSVRVTNLDNQYVILDEGFTYNAIPIITSIAPNYGSSSGGTRIIIEGTGFLQGATTIIGELPATTQVKSDTTIEATAPALPQGVWDVRVVNPDTQEVAMTKGFISVGGVAYNYPNPFRATQGTTFRYVTNDPVQSITVKIFNMAGVPIDVVQQTDSSEVKWQNSEIYAGLYMYLMEVELENSRTKQLRGALEVYE